MAVSTRTPSKTLQSRIYDPRYCKSIFVKIRNKI